MGEALLRRRFRERRIGARVSSAGFLAGGAPATPEAVDTMAAVGLDISQHRSRQISAPLIEKSNLVLTMTRQHVIELTLMAPDAWPRVFQITDLVRRAEQVGPWPADGSFSDWLAAVGRDRSRAGLLGASLQDDVADPVGQSAAVYDHTMELLDDLCTRLAALI